MRRIILIIIISCSLSSFSQNTCLNVYLNCLNSIQENSVTKDYLLKELGNDSLKILVSEIIIPFKHFTIVEDLIRKDYIEHYSSLSNLQEDEIILERRINDSLLNLDIEYNKKYLKNTYPELKILSDCGEPNLILFFSTDINQTIYLELMPYFEEFFSDNKKSYNYPGRVLTFLIRINDQGKVINNYHGFIHYQ